MGFYSMARQRYHLQNPFIMDHLWTSELKCFVFLPGALVQLTKNLACEWAKDNIRTNSVAPWYIKTSLVEHVRISSFLYIIFIENDLILLPVTVPLIFVTAITFHLTQRD